MPHQAPGVPSVSVDQLPDGALLLDVREPQEWAAGHIAEAVHVPMNALPGRLTRDPDSLPTNGPIVVICKVGARSAQVTVWLRSHGYDALNLDGGMLSWAQAGRPMEADDSHPPRVA